MKRARTWRRKRMDRYARREFRSFARMAARWVLEMQPAPGRKNLRRVDEHE